MPCFLDQGCMLLDLPEGLWHRGTLVTEAGVIGAHICVSTVPNIIS